MKMYLVVEIDRKDNVPTIIGLYRTQRGAELAAYAPERKWCNIIELTVKD